MTVFAETNVDVDLRMLRSFRVLRPLKLVSKIPSESVRVLRKNSSDKTSKERIPASNKSS